MRINLYDVIRITLAFTLLPQVFSPGSCSGGTGCFSMIIIISLVFYFALLSSSAAAMWMLEFSYAIDPRAPLNMTKDTASYLITTGSVSHLVSRIVCIFISPFIRIQTLLAVCVVGQLASVAIYVFLGLRYSTWLWIGTAARDIFQQAFWPGGFLWAENYIHVYALIVGIVDIGNGLFNLATVWLNGHLFDIHPAYPFYLSFALTCLFCVHFAGMQLIASYFTRNKDKELGYDTVALLPEDEEEETEIAGGDELYSGEDRDTSDENGG